MGINPDWWFGTMEFYDFPFSWEWKIIPTDELIHIFFQRGRYTNHQPDMLLTIINQVPYSNHILTTINSTITTY